MVWNPVVWVNESRQFLIEVRSEFRKVTWPSRKEATAGTIGVLVVVTVITTVLGVFDAVLSQVVQLIVPG
jgi:preprotein translocase subunit SecE